MRVNVAAWRLFPLACLVAVVLAAGCSGRTTGSRTNTEPPVQTVTPLDMDAYAQWSRHNSVAEFENYLFEARLAGVVPTPELLRTATDWKKCGGPEFEIPPREQWPEVRKVLSLLSELKTRRILVDFEAVSNFRNAHLNACAGGARQSAHTQSFAVDIISRSGKVDENMLCEFWRTDGKRWEMGLARYSSGRIHLDTTRYRTWGSDHRKGTSFCGQPAG